MKNFFPLNTRSTRNGFFISCLWCLSWASAPAASPLGATFNNDLELKLWTNTAKLVSATNTGTTGRWSGSATQSWAYATQPTNGLGVGKLSAISNITLTATTQTARVQWTYAGGADGVRLWRGPQTTNLTQYLPMTSGITNFSDTGAFTNWVTNGAQTVTATNTPGIIFADGTTQRTASAGAITNISTTVSGLGVSSPGGPNVAITGSVSATVAYGVISNTAYNGAAGAAASNLAAAALASNVWAAADSTTNYASRTGGPYIRAVDSGYQSAVSPLAGPSLFIGGTSGTFQVGMRIGEGTYSGRFGFWNDGTRFGTYIYNSGLLDANGGFGGDHFRVEFVGNNAATTFPISVKGDVSASSGVATVVVSRIESTVGFFGNGAGLTNLPSSGGGGTVANQRSFEWRDTEGSLNVGWTKTLAPSVNLISVRTATNDLSFAAYATTPATTLQTNTLYVMFEHPVTGAIPWAVKSSQVVTGGLVIFTPKDGQNFDAAITQTLAAAGTLYVTNQALTITAKTATVEVRLATTNSANLLQLGVDVQ